MKLCKNLESHLSLLLRGKKVTKVCPCSSDTCCSSCLHYLTLKSHQCGEETHGSYLHNSWYRLPGRCVNLSKGELDLVLLCGLGHRLRYWCQIWVKGQEWMVLLAETQRQFLCQQNFRNQFRLVLGIDFSIFECLPVRLLASWSNLMNVRLPSSNSLVLHFQKCALRF